MATKYEQIATKQLAPAFGQQQEALSSKIPAIQNLYQTLLTGLGGQRDAAVQGTNESQAGRGLLRSTITNDLQTGVQANYLQQEGQLRADELGQIGDIRGQLASSGIEQAQSISNLADMLEQRGLQTKQFNSDRSFQNRQLYIQKAEAKRQRSLQKKLADRQYKLDKQRVAGGF